MQVLRKFDRLDWHGLVALSAASGLILHLLLANTFSHNADYILLPLTNHAKQTSDQHAYAAWSQTCGVLIRGMRFALLQVHRLTPHAIIGFSCRILLLLIIACGCQHKTACWLCFNQLFFSRRVQLLFVRSLWLTHRG